MFTERRINKLEEQVAIFKSLFHERDDAVIKANKKIAVLEEQLESKISCLKRQLAEAEKSVLVLRVRSRIEELEKNFLEPSVRKSCTRSEKWGKIFHGDINTLRRQVELQTFRSMVTVDVKQFIQVICDIYGDFSDHAAHNVQYNVDYDEKSVIKMLCQCKIIPNRAKIDAIFILMKPIP